MTPCAPKMPDEQAQFTSIAPSASQLDAQLNNHNILDYRPHSVSRTGAMMPKLEVYSTVLALSICVFLSNLSAELLPSVMTEELQQVEIDSAIDGENMNFIAADGTNGLQGGNTELSSQPAAASDQEQESRPADPVTVAKTHEESNARDTNKDNDHSMMIKLNLQSSSRNTLDGYVGRGDQDSRKGFRILLRN
eukprot:CCRYP_014856-RA/>CCRYP_014856-RA protein AED:0.11 eAED:0.09 QI:0/0.57/0.62/0.87/0.42/0.25/8/3367/192